MILVLVLYSILGFTLTLSKLLLTYATPFFLVGARMLLAGVGLLGYSYKSRGSLRAFNTHDWFLILQFTLFGVIIPHVGRTWSLQYLSPVKTALLFNLSPFFAAFFNYIFINERLSKIQALGLMIGFGGTLPLFATHHSAKGAAGLFEFSLPDLITLIAVASLSYSLLVMQQLVKHRSHSPILANGFTMLLGGFCAFNAAVFSEPVWIKGSVPIFVALLLLNIVVSNFLCANLMAWLLRKHSSTFMAFASFLSPIFAAIYSWLLWGECVSWNFLLALVLVISGLAIFFYDGLKKQIPAS